MVHVEPAAIVTFAGATVDHQQYGSPGALRISNRKHGHWGYHDPRGKQSGGRFNPAMTFTLYRLGKLELWDTYLQYRF